MGRIWRGAWEEGAERAGEGGWVAFASWARGEPERGSYDDGELHGYRRALSIARKRGADPVVVVHAGALPDWMIARGGWADPDAPALWGCWVDRMAHALNEAVHTWIALWDPIGEARVYDTDARRVGRVLLDAQAAAYLQLHRGSGARASRVGAFVPGADGLRERFTASQWVKSAASGRVHPPFGLVGELPNGTPALDFVAGGAWDGVPLLELG